LYTLPPTLHLSPHDILKKKNSKRIIEIDEKRLVNPSWPVAIPSWPPHFSSPHFSSFSHDILKKKKSKKFIEIDEKRL
jgi:hypothetical protein